MRRPLILLSPLIEAIRFRSKNHADYGKGLSLNYSPVRAGPANRNGRSFRSRATHRGDMLHTVSRPSERQTMRKKIAAGIGLVAVVLVVTVLICDRLGKGESRLRLRVGMKVLEEMIEENGNPNDLYWDSDGNIHVSYDSEPDFLGNRQTTDVIWEQPGIVVSWTVKPLPRARPPWLDGVLKAVGW
jgi:hypothetical protein